MAIAPISSQETELYRFRDKINEIIRSANGLTDRVGTLETGLAAVVPLAGLFELHMGQAGAGHAGGVTQFYGPTGTNANADTAFLMGRPYEILGIRGRLVTAPGGAESTVATLYKNGSSTAITFTFGAADTTKNATGSVTGVAGDYVALQVAASASAATTRTIFSIIGRWT